MNLSKFSLCTIYTKAYIRIAGNVSTPVQSIVAMYLTHYFSASGTSILNADGADTPANTDDIMDNGVLV